MYVIAEVGSTGTYYSAPPVFAIQCASLLSVGASEICKHVLTDLGSVLQRPIEEVLLISQGKPK